MHFAVVVQGAEFLAVFIVIITCHVKKAFMQEGTE